MAKKLLVHTISMRPDDAADDFDSGSRDDLMDANVVPPRRPSKPTPVTAIVSFSISDQSRIIEMAWEDRTPFEAIEALYGLTPAQLVQQMRAWLKPSSFRLWRQRMNGRVTKHAALRPAGVSRGYCPTQYKR